MFCQSSQRPGEHGGEDRLSSRLIVRLDRLRWVAWVPAGKEVPFIPGFKTVSDRRIMTRPGKVPTYGRVRKLESMTSDARADWEYQRQQGWLEPWRITLIADDQTGLTLEEVKQFLEHCCTYRLVLVELALDFAPASGVNAVFVEQHGLFGKSRRRPDLGGPGQLRYGSRRSGKLVRCYWKDQIGAYRVELELHSRLLREHEIDRVRDICRVSGVIFPKHCRFVTFAWERLQRYLERRFGQRCERILAVARRLANLSLRRASRYLRRKGVNNVHRFLVSLRMNREIEKALLEWSIKFGEAMND